MKPLRLLSAIGLAWGSLCGASYALDPYVAAQLRGLDKITGAATDFTLGVGETMTLGGIDVTMHACWKAPPEDPPESVAFLEIASNYQNAENEKIFSGWMFASSPGLNALEHSVYDVWVISCTALAPDSWDGSWDKKSP